MFSHSCRDVGKTPYEAFTGKRPNVSFLRPFGSRSYVHIPKTTRNNKLSPRALKGILVGYAFDSCYRILVEQNGVQRIVVSKDVDFDETPLSLAPGPSAQHPENVEFPSEGKKDDEKTTPAQNEHNEADPSVTETGEPFEEDTTPDEADVEPVTYVPGVRRSRRVTKQPERFDAMLVHQCMVSSAADPLTVEEALASTEGAEWRAAMDEELDMIEKLKFWSPILLPKGKKVVRIKWVFERKRDADGNVIRYRARLCAKGFTQIHGADYEEVFTPVARYTTFRVMM